MAEKNFNSRIVLKHDTQDNWEKATTFVPKDGELIIYEVDDNYSYPRIKIGDGTTKVGSLPFLPHTEDFADALKTLDFSDPTASGTSTSFIATLSQQDGAITATKKSIPTASGTTLGMVKGSSGDTGDVTIANGLISVKDNSHSHTITNITNLQTTLDSKATPADITNALAALDFTSPTASTTTSTTFIDTVTQADGAVTATKKTIPTANGTTLGMVKGGGDVAITNGVITVSDNSHKHTSANISDLSTTIQSAITTAVEALSASDPTASTTTSTTFIDTISQEDGVITATKKTLPTAGTNLGMVKSGGDVTISSGVISVKDDSHNHIITNIDGLQAALDAKATPANITTAIEALDYGGATASGNSTSFITQVTQTNGVVSATKASIPIATSTQAGLVKSGTDITVDANGNVSVNNNSHSHTASNISDLSSTMTSAINAAIGTLDAADPAASGTSTSFISSIKQENGVIVATKANITAASLGLSGAMKFLGTTTTAISNGSTTSSIKIGSSTITAASGNVVLYGKQEFVWNGSSWTLLGDEGSYKIKQTAVSSPSASGNATAFIDTISQDVNGNITATKKNIPAATTTAAGLMSATDKTALEAYKCDELGSFSGKTIADLRTALGNWANSVLNYPGATATFSCNPWSALWNAEDLTTALTAGGQWLVTLESYYVANSYLQLKISQYVDKYVFYVARVDGVWKPANQVLFDRSGITASQLPTSGVTAGTYGLDAAASPAHGGKFLVPKIVVDNKGRITSAAEYEVTLPADNNTDTKNTAGSTNTSSKIFLIGATSQAANPQTYSHDTVYVDTDGNLNTSKLIVNTTNTPGIKMNRGAYNYIQGGDNAPICLVANNTVGLANASLIAAKTEVHPGANNTFNLGSSTYKWKNVYATTFTGNLTGNVTGNVSGSAATLKTARKINSVAFDGSADITFQGSYVSNTTTSSIPQGLSYIELPATATVTGDPTHGAILTTFVNAARAFQIAGNSANALYFRGLHSTALSSDAGLGYGPWRKVLDDNNYTSYTVTKTGGGASGNWNITAAKATADGSGNTITSTYLKLSGGTMTGNLVLPVGTDVYSNASLYFGTKTRIGTGNDNAFGIYSSGNIMLRPNNGTLGYTDGIVLSTTSLIPTKNNTVSFGDSSHYWKSAYATTFYGALSGNAMTATALATGRTLKVNLGSTTASTAFTGTANVHDIGITGTLAVGHGGTGHTSAKNAANAFMNALETGSSTPQDADYYISQYVGGGTATTTYHRRPMSTLWNYIKTKMNTDGNAATATKLKTAFTLSLAGAADDSVTIDGSANRTLIINGIKEAYLEWGGKNINGGVSPIGAALSAEHSANRLAYFNAAGITVETSNDGGSTWTTASTSDADKVKLVTTSTVITVGTASTVTTNHRTRITFTAQNGTTGYMYTRPRKLLLDVSTPHGLSVTLEAKKGTSGAAWETIGTYAISGWSGWNDIPLSIATIGGGTNQASNYWYFRLTYINTSVNTSYNTTLSTIRAIRLFGDTCWTKTSNMGETGHLYAYDENQNGIFPSNVIVETATTNKGFMIRANNKIMGQFICSTLGSTTATGNCHLVLGNNLDSSVEGNARGSLTLYSTKTTAIKLLAYAPEADRILYLRDHGRQAYIAATSSQDAVGGATTAPVYVNNKGLLTAMTSVDIAHGGTGATTAIMARENLLIKVSNTQPTSPTTGMIWLDIS